MESPHKGKTGIRRLLNAFGYSCAGLREAFRNEDAFRQEVLLAGVLVPLAFVLADPAGNGLAGAVLIYSFIGTGCTFLAFAVLAAKRGTTSTAYPGQGFYSLGGLTESTETIAVFVLMCLLPQWFGLLAYGFAGLCALTTITRIAAGMAVFKDESRHE